MIACLNEKISRVLSAAESDETAGSMTLHRVLTEDIVHMACGHDRCVDQAFLEGASVG